MEKLDKVIAGLKFCGEANKSVDACLMMCPYYGERDGDKVCMDFLIEDALDLLKEYRELMERNTWPCWECEYAWMKFRKYKIMFGPDNCDLHRDKMCPVLDEEEPDGNN